LWSDPIEDSTAQGLTDEELEEWLEVDYLANPTRGCGYVFGYAGVETFLRENSLLTLVRAHEVQKNGYYCHYFWKRGLPFPPVITVFSAPNYCDMYGNLAAFLCIRRDRYTFHQVAAVEHPYMLPNFMNAITFSLPYALEAFTKLCAYILEGCMMMEDDEEEPVQALTPHIERGVHSFGKLSIFMQKIREKRDEIVQGTINLGEEVKQFEQALQLDGKNEKRPQILTRRRTRTM
jgi:serine/threonine-protein phosphatase 2B catalytic subunit